jgi:hypothetical protein
MSYLFSLVLVMTLHSLAPLTWAEPALEPAPAFTIPFDDDDPAALQAEIAQQATAFLRRLEAHWGQDAEPLRHTVPGTIERDETSQLVYTRGLAAHAVLEGYEFVDGSLVRGRYFVMQRPMNRLNEFIEYYDAVKRVLAEAYGKPTHDRIIWENDLYQPVPDYWGVAVMIGYLRYAAAWHTPDGTITMELTGDHHSTLTIEYRSTRLLENERVAALKSPMLITLETSRTFCHSTASSRPIVFPCI